MRTYAIYDQDDCPVVIGSIHFCTGKLNIKKSTFYDMLNKTKRQAKGLKHTVYLVDEDDEKLETYLVDHKRWDYQYDEKRERK